VRDIYTFVHKQQQAPVAAAKQLQSKAATVSKASGSEQGQRLSVEEQRRRKRAARFAEEGQADPAAGGGATGVDEGDAAGAGAEGIAAGAAVVRVPAQKAAPEQQRRLKRAERFAGGDETEDSGAPASASAASAAERVRGPKRPHSLLGRALGAALTVSTDDTEQLAKRSRASANGDSPLPTPLRRIQNEKLGLAARHQKEVAVLKRRHQAEMRALERRELETLANAVSEAKGGANPCAVCSKKVQAGQFFVCAECAAPVCTSHKQVCIVNVCVYTYTHTHTHTCACVRCVCVCVCVQVLVYLYTHTHTHTHAGHEPVLPVPRTLL